MRHLTQDRPKGLTPLHGTPLIARQCTALRGAGVDWIGIVTGYMAEQFDPYADACFHNADWAATQMVTSLAAADAVLQDEPIVVSYSDIFYDAQPVRALMAADADIAITYDPDWERQWTGRFGDPLSDAETFRLRSADDGTQVLTEIGRQPRTLDEIQGQYMGLLRFTPAGWAQAQAVRADLAPDVCAALSMTALLDLLVARGARIQAIATAGPWGEIDSVEDLAYFEEGDRLRP